MAIIIIQIAFQEVEILPDIAVDLNVGLLGILTVDLYHFGKKYEGGAEHDGDYRTQSFNY